MPRRQQQTSSTRNSVPRTAADVLAEGWQEGEDFEISFMATDTRGQQSTGTGRQQSGRRS